MNPKETQDFLQMFLTSLSRDLWDAAIQARGETDIRDTIAMVCSSYAERLAVTKPKTIGFVKPEGR